MVLQPVGSKDVLGVLRMIPYPVTDEEVMYARKDFDEGRVFPGAGRTERDVQQALLDRVKTKTKAEDGSYVLLSGAKLGRIAIAKPLRGTGLGRKLVLHTEAWVQAALAQSPEVAAAQKADAVVQLSAQVIAKDFYERCVIREKNANRSTGYTPSGPVYHEQGQPHVWYSKTLRVKG